MIFPTTRLIKRSFRQRRDLYRCHFPSKIQAKLKMNSFPETLIQILSLGRIARKQNDHSKIPPEPPRLIFILKFSDSFFNISIQVSPGIKAILEGG